MNKRIRAFLLAALMVASLLPAMSMATDVSDAAAFKAAMEAGGDVKLAQDIVLTEGVTVPAGKTVTLDLNGKTVSYVSNVPGEDMITNRGSLTISDSKETGKITYQNTDTTASNVSVNTISNEAGGTLVIYGGTFENNSSADLAWSGRIMPFIVDNLTNGDLGVASTTIYGGTFNGYYRSVRQFANSASCKNELIIKGGTFNGQIWMQSPNAKQNMAVTAISAGSFEPRGYDGSSVYIAVQSSTEVEVSVSGGTFKTKIGTDNANAIAGAITGGSFSADAAEKTPAALLGSNISFGSVGSDGYVTARGPVYGGPPMNWVKCSATDNGIVKSGPLAASEGATITLYPKAAAGYVLDTVEVLDAEGNAVELNGLKFRVPLGGVTVNATFKPAN